MSRFPLCCTFILLMACSLIVPSLRAQCSDCVGLGGEFNVPIIRVEKGATAPDRRARAQAGDVTAVAIPEGTDEIGAADSLQGRSWLGQPGSTINTPTAFGPGWGQVYVGMSYQDRIRYSDWHDGIVAVGAGFGNPRRTVGLAAAVTVLDTYTDFGQDRSLSLKLHRRLPWRSAVAVGYENLWHTDGTDGGDSRYGVVSTVMPLRDDLTAPFGSVVLSGGLGDDRFLAEERFARGERGTSAFGSVGLRLLRSTNGIVNWSGQDLNLGLSIVPLRAFPVVVTPAVLDVTGRAGDGARFAVSASIGYNARR
jgi:hypothetical protein